MSGGCTLVHFGAVVGVTGAGQGAHTHIGKFAAHVRAEPQGRWRRDAATRPLWLYACWYHGRLRRWLEWIVVRSKYRCGRYRWLC